MHIELKAFGLDLTDSLRSYSETQIVDPLRRVFDREGASLEIELSDDNGPKGGLDKRCRITFAMPHTKTITVTQMSTDIYQSIDLASKRFRRLVNRYKGWKLQGTRYPTKHYVAALEQMPEPGEEAASPDDITQEDDSLAAAEARERRETNPPPFYAGEPSASSQSEGEQP